jgi:hypothetical protein
MDFPQVDRADVPAISENVARFSRVAVDQILHTLEVLDCDIILCGFSGHRPTSSSISNLKNLNLKSG